MTPVTIETLPNLMTSLKAGLAANKPRCGDCKQPITSDDNLRQRLEGERQPLRVCRTCFNEELAEEILESRAKS